MSYSYPFIIGSGGGAPGPAGPPGESGSAGYTPNTLLLGGGVSYVGGYVFEVSAAQYYILDTLYSSAQGQVTLATADATLNRIDVIALDENNAIVVVQGTNAASPVKPSVDPATQLELTFVYITATTGVTGMSVLSIYAENTEWTSAKSGAPINLASTVNPHLGTKCVEGTSAVAGNYFQFTAPGAGDVTTRNNLVLFIRSKATWANNKAITMRWYNSTVAKGQAVTLNNGAFNFSSANVTTYQQIVVPLSLFGVAGIDVDVLRFTVAGGGAAIGFYVDDISLQGGVGVTTTPTATMFWRGPWSTLTAYNVNDVVNSGGRTWIATVQNNGVTPVVGTTWIELAMTNPMTAGGDLIYGGTSGLPTRLANGTAGKVLQSNGTTLAPTWETAAASTPAYVTAAAVQHIYTFSGAF